MALFRIAFRIGRTWTSLLERGVIKSATGELCRQTSYLLHDVPVSQHFTFADSDFATFRDQRYYQFVDYHKFDREVVAVALNFFDRYISKSKLDVLVMEAYQLIAVGSLFLAIKLQRRDETGHSGACAEALDKLCRGRFDENLVLHMESELLQALNWYTNPPTMHQFALAFYNLLSPDGDTAQANSYVFEATRYQAEIAVFVPDFLAQYKPSTIVYAAMLNAMEKFLPHMLTREPQEDCEFYSLTKNFFECPQVMKARACMKELCPELPSAESLMVHPTIEDPNSESAVDGDHSPTSVTDL